MANGDMTKSDTTLTIFYLVSGVVLTVLAGIAYIVLRDDNDARSGLMLYALPIITGLFVAAKVEQSQGDTRERLQNQDQILTTIASDVNGNLTRRMREVFGEELAKRDATQTAALIKHQGEPFNPNLNTVDANDHRVMDTYISSGSGNTQQGEVR